MQTNWQKFCLIQRKAARLNHLKYQFMATLNEISLVLGLLASGLFYLQYKKYEAEAEKEEMINSFLSE